MEGAPRPPSGRVVPGRLELPASTLSVWRSNQLSYGTVRPGGPAGLPQRYRKGKGQGRHKQARAASEPERRLRAEHGACSRKEVFQPHLPVRLPCYDLAPITGFTLGRPSRSRTSGAPGFHGLTGGVYKARERIHRAMADARLLANPASWGRVADPSPN